MKSMSRWFSFVFIAVALTMGCNKETEEGGPGVTPGAKTENADEATFTLSLPDGVNATQTESNDTSISLDAGDNFNQPVNVTLTVPAGVTITPTEFVLSKDKDEQTLMIRADATAKEGDHMVSVVGKPTTGKEVTSSFKVTVDIDE